MLTRVATVALLVCCACGTPTRHAGPAEETAARRDAVPWRWATLTLGGTGVGSFVVDETAPQAFVTAGGGPVSDVAALSTPDLVRHGTYLRTFPPGDGQPVTLYLGDASWIVEEYEVEGQLRSSPLRLPTRTDFDWPDVRFPHVDGAHLEFVRVDRKGSHVFPIDLAPPPSAPGPPPWTVYHIAGARPSDDSFNVVLVGDGFTRDDIDQFRGATSRLAHAVLEDEGLYRPYRDRISFLRIDVLDPGGGVDRRACDGECGDEPLRGEEPVRRAADVALAGLSPFYETDFGVERCAGPSGVGLARCKQLRLSPTTGSDRVADLLRSLRGHLQVDAVGVMANLRQHTGSAKIVFDPRLTTGVFVFSVQPKRGTGLFAHELGHAIGLLDEEQGDSRPDNLPFMGSRNVWFTNCDLPFTGLSFCRLDDLIWPMPAGCSPSTLEPCPPAETDCSYAVWNVPDTDLCKTSPLWEGAFYSNHRFYRSAFRCIMREGFGSFCPGCRAHLDATLARGATTRRSRRSP